jgi:hypothetical protein
MGHLKPAASKEGPLLPAPASVPLPSNRLERRDLQRRDALVRRVVNEFDEMPGLSLSLAQASRLLGLAEEACARIFLRLVDQGRLRRDPYGRYIRRDQRP